MTKKEYRSFFASVKPFIKVNFFLKELGLSQPMFSTFMKGNDWCMSVAKLDLLYNAVIDRCAKIA